MANVLVDQPSETLNSEEWIVLEWRVEQFGRLGFGSADARLLAESTADLGDARQLCRSGCSLDLAFRILV